MEEENELLFQYSTLDGVSQESWSSGGQGCFGTGGNISMGGTGGGVGGGG